MSLFQNTQPSSVSDTLTLYIALKSLASQQRIITTIFQPIGWKKIGSGWLVSRGSFGKRSFAKIALFLCCAVWRDVQKWASVWGHLPDQSSEVCKEKQQESFLRCPKAEHKDFLMPVFLHQTQQHIVKKRARSFANFKPKQEKTTYQQ